MLSPVLAVRPFFLAFCRGAFLGPVRFCIFRILSNIGGVLRLLAPSEALFLDARRQGCFWSILSVVFVFFLRLFRTD